MHALLPCSPSPQLVIVMVVQPGESNAIDQRILEYTLWKKLVEGAHGLTFVGSSCRAEVSRGARVSHLLLLSIPPVIRFL